MCVSVAVVLLHFGSCVSMENIKVSFLLFSLSFYLSKINCDFFSRAVIWTTKVVADQGADKLAMIYQLMVEFLTLKAKPTFNNVDKCIEKCVI